MADHPPHIDFGKLVVTVEIMTGYVISKYGMFNISKDDPMIDTIIDDIYDTFYRDEMNKKKKTKEEANLAIIKGKYSDFFHTP